MLESIKPYLWIAEVALAAILGVIGAVGGYKYAHKDTLIVQGKLDIAHAAIQQRDRVINDNQIALKKAQQEEDAAKAREAKAAKDLIEFKQEQAKQDKEFTKNIPKIIKKPECAILKERLCPAAMGY